ncbi:MAG: hypothetical protein ACI8PB_004694 [Desulforhopalus sp.]|jgi:hypothetical protein
MEVLPEEVFLQNDPNIGFFRIKRTFRHRPVPLS